METSKKILKMAILPLAALVSQYCFASNTADAAQFKESKLVVAESMAAEAGLSVVYDNGSSDMIDRQGTNQIVIMAASSNNVSNEALIRNLLMNGNIIISSGEEIRTDIAKIVSTSLLATNNAKAKAMSATSEDLGNVVMIDGETTQKSNARAYFYSPTLSGKYETFGKGLTDSLADAIQWSREAKLEISRARYQPKASDSAGTASVYTEDMSANCTNGSASYRATYGKVAVDNDDQFAYWIVGVKVQSVPKSSKQTSFVANFHDINSKFPAWIILDSGPIDTGGETTVGVNLGYDTTGLLSAGWSWTYQVPDVQVVQSSDWSKGIAQWFHYIKKGTSSAKNSYVVNPGFTFRTPNSAINPWRNHYHYFSATQSGVGCGAKFTPAS
jgi:hypothetical protein